MLDEKRALWRGLLSEKNSVAKIRVAASGEDDLLKYVAGVKYDVAGVGYDIINPPIRGHRDCSTGRYFIEFDAVRLSEWLTDELAGFEARLLEVSKKI